MRYDMVYGRLCVLIRAVAVVSFPSHHLNIETFTRSRSFHSQNWTKHTTLPKLKLNNAHCTHHLQRAIEVHQYKQYQFIRSNHWTVYSVGIWVNLNIYMDQGSLYASITIKILAESLTLQTIYSWWFRQTHFHHQSETLHQPVSTRCFNKIK